MDCNHPTNGDQYIARSERKSKPLKRKIMDLAHAGHELQPKEKQVKRRTETKEKDMKSEKTETCVESPCSAPDTQSKVKSLKRKRMAVPRDGPEPQRKKMAEKRTRTEDEKRDFFNRYIIGELLGQGSFGFVYEGFRKSDRKKVALKLMRKDSHITLPGDTHSLPLEVALLKLVCKPPLCPNVIEMLDWFETSNVTFLVLERPDPCVELFNYFNDVKISESQAKMIMRQIIQAACHCRDRGVFHRDIKEENILLNPQTFEIKLIDFGCGALLKDTPYTAFAGTETFQTPEWITEQAYEAEPATVWGLGILLYRLLCRAQPFENAVEIVDGHLFFPVYISEASRSLIWWCLQRDPKRRPRLEQVLTHNWFSGQEAVVELSEHSFQQSFYCNCTNCFHHLYHHHPPHHCYCHPHYYGPPPLFLLIS